jgi:ATP-dependent protease HslVU (ClpYQ) peptidase subunit
MGGDTLLLHKDCDHKNDKCSATAWRLRTIASNGQLALVKINDARLKADIQKAKDWWAPNQDALRKLDAIKVVIDSLGRIHQAGG